MTEANLEAVIIKFAGELVVALGLQVCHLVGSRLRREHLGQVLHLSVDLEFVQGRTFATGHVVVGVRVLLRLLQLLEHRVVDSADVAVLKCLLAEFTL